MIPYGKQSIDEDDIKALIKVLKSDYLTCGPEISTFEEEFAKAVGARHAVAVCNATAALHLAMRVAKIESGDRVVTSPNTFVSSANCAAFVGATPDFCDIDPNTYNLCPKALEAGWKEDTKAVIAVAYGGQSCDMPAISEIARSHGAIVIEDGCHGTGGGFEVDGQSYKIGGHPWADMTTFSFHPVKTMTTGEGGILVTNNDAYAQSARDLRAHGITREVSSFTGLGGESTALKEHGPWYYEMQSLGYNYRITDFQCALGRSQLKKLPSFISRRREIVARYNEAFADLPWLQTPQLLNPKDKPHISWHLYSVQIDFATIGKSRTEVMHCLQSQGVGSQVLYIPVHLQPYYRNTFGYAAGKCPVAEAYYEKALSIPLFPTMSDENIETVIQSVRDLSS